MIRKLLHVLSAALFAGTCALPALRAAEPTTVPTSGASAPKSAFVQLKRGDVAPEFTVTGPKGESIKLSDFKGKIVIVDVSATWCGPCQAAMPNNDRIYRKYADQGVVLLGITADDTRAAYDGWIKRNADKYKFTMAFDPVGREGWEKSVFNTGYHVTGFPTMFVVGRDGKISETVSGGGAGEDYRLEYAIARAGAKVDLASIPPEPKKDPNAPKSIPAVKKTMAMAAASGASSGAASGSAPMIGMGAPAPASGGSGFTPEKFGSVARDAMVPDFTVTGTDGQPVKLSSFRGKPLLVQFCTSNGPQAWFGKTAATYKDQGLVALAVFSATERADFDKWVAANPNPGFAVAWDSAGKAWAENVTNTIFGVGMYPATAIIKADGTLWSGFIGMGDKVVAMTYSSLLRAGIKITQEHGDALIAAGGGFRMGAATPGVAVAAAAIMPAPASAAPAVARPALLAAGAVAPDFTMRDVNDKEVHLADFKGKVVILDFWATWCGPCISSFPHTQKIAAKYKADGVVVLASGTSDTAAAFKKWIPANQPKYPDMVFVFDPKTRPEQGSDDKAAADNFAQRASSSLYRVSGIPTQFVIGRDGKVVASIVGNEGDTDTRTEGALALAGVKVDEAIAAKGKAALAKSAEDEKRAEAARAEAAKNPRPPFSENYAKLIAGQPVPDLTLQNADGQPVKLSSLIKGKTAVFAIASGGGLRDDGMKYYEPLSRKYADQGVVVITLSAYVNREDFDQWRTANAGKFSFTALFDPVGRAPQPVKSMEEMTPEEKKDFMTKQREHMAKGAPLVFTGGAMAPVPHTYVIDAKGNMAGIVIGGGAHVAEGVGNLLLRAGVKLAPEDMPKRVWTAEETKPKAPEARVEMLKVGAAAPDFPATDVAGKPVKLSDYRGKIVILDFWATWCGPCIASMPHTNEVAAHYKDQGVVVLASCTSDGRKAFEAWVAKNQATYPEMIFSHDPLEKSADRASRKLYGVGGIPQQFIIDRDGKIAGLCTGYLKGEVLLEAALAKAGVKVAPEILAKAKLDQANRDAMR
jgi:peroxiredoxin